MFRVVGFHLPPSCHCKRDFLLDKFDLAARIRPYLTFERRVYSKHLTDNEKQKQERFTTDKAELLGEDILEGWIKKN